MCVCVCACACVRACTCARARACVCVSGGGGGGGGYHTFFVVVGFLVFYVYHNQLDLLLVIIVLSEYDLFDLILCMCYLFSLL